MSYLQVVGSEEMRGGGRRWDGSMWQTGRWEFLVGFLYFWTL